MRRTLPFGKEGRVGGVDADAKRERVQPAEEGRILREQADALGLEGLQGERALSAVGGEHHRDAALRARDAEGVQAGKPQTIEMLPRAGKDEEIGGPRARDARPAPEP
jgi:hypothetical protein